MGEAYQSGPMSLVFQVDGEECEVHYDTAEDVERVKGMLTRSGAELRVRSVPGGATVLTITVEPGHPAGVEIDGQMEALLAMIRPRGSAPA